MAILNNLTGGRFSRWTVIQLSGMNPTKWLCKCMCGAIKSVHANSLLRGLSKSCGCYSSEVTRQRSLNAYKLPEVRFWKFVQKKDNDSCWNWIGSKHRFGYGKFFVGRLSQQNLRRIHAHVFSWEWHNKRKVPNGLCVLHGCGNPSCVNPRHLRIGTAKENAADMVKDGHSQLGEKNFNVRLSIQKVKTIRLLYAKGYTQVELGKKFCVSSTSIHNVLHRKTWKHVV